MRHGEYLANAAAFRKGDYHRYLAEFASGDKRKTAATAAHDAYKVSKSIILHLLHKQLLTA